MATAKPAQPSGRLSFAQIESVWVQAGGSENWAPIMAAIAMAESGGNPYAHNSNAATGDDSYGLWQINYFGSLRASRTARYGQPSSLYDPVRNARAALDLLGSSGSGITNWSTFNNGAYQQYLPANVKNSTKIAGSPYQRAPGSGSELPLIPGIINLNPGATKSVDSALAKLNPLHGIEKDILYGVAFLGGALLLIAGFILVGADIGIAVFSRRKVAQTTQRIYVRVAPTPGARQERDTRRAERDASHDERRYRAQARVNRAARASEAGQKRSFVGPNQRRLSRQTTKEDIPF